MNVRALDLPGAVLLEPIVHEDPRGRFMESWHRTRYGELGITDEFVQDNLSHSGARVLRGLHFQHPRSQGKLISVIHGEIFDVAVDVRLGSPTFGRAISVVLSDENARQLYLPVGFAHGFVVLSELAIVGYKCSEHYDASAESVLLWNDPALSIPWPIEHPLVSEKDAAGLRLQDLPHDRLPRFVADVSGE